MGWPEAFMTTTMYVGTLAAIVGAYAIWKNHGGRF